MCDYSLYHFPNRLACDGEALVTYRFTSGCVGFASAADLSGKPEPLCLGWNWRSLRSLFLPRLYPEPVAVCIPPGSLLRLSPIAKLGRSLQLREREDAVLCQRTGDEFTFRDALRLQDGREISLQDFPPGLPILVLSTTAQLERDVTLELQRA